MQVIKSAQRCPHSHCAQVVCGIGLQQMRGARVGRQLSGWASETSPLKSCLHAEAIPRQPQQPRCPGQVTSSPRFMPALAALGRVRSALRKPGSRFETVGSSGASGAIGMKFNPHRLPCPAVGPRVTGIKKIQRRTPNFFLFLSFGGEQLVDLAKDSSLSPPANITLSNLC
jgi:hypothetical protein